MILEGMLNHLHCYNTQVTFSYTQRRDVCLKLVFVLLLPKENLT